MRHSGYAIFSEMLGRKEVITKVRLYYSTEGPAGLSGNDGQAMKSNIWRRLNFYIFNVIVGFFTLIFRSFNSIPRQAMLVSYL